MPGLEIRPVVQVARGFESTPSAKVPCERRYRRFAAASIVPVCRCKDLLLLGSRSLPGTDDTATRTMAPGTADGATDLAGNSPRQAAAKNGKQRDRSSGAENRFTVRQKRLWQSTR